MQSTTKNLIITLFISLALTLALFASIDLAQPGDLPRNSHAAPQPEIDTAIADGVLWLAANQEGNGSWSYHVAYTCFALSALEQHAYDLGFDTWDDPGYTYRDNIIQGWQYVLVPARTLKVSPLPVQWAGDPDSNGNGYGVSFEAQTYFQGPCMAALEASGTPNRENDGGLDYNGDGSPDTFLELAQEAVEWTAFAQIDGGSGRGNWFYGAENNGSVDPDQSNGGFAVLGLAAAERLGATVPAFVRAELDYAIDYIQCNPGDDGYSADKDGGAGYSSPCSIVNEYKAGFLILQMGFYGDTPGVPRFQKALDYVERHWRGTSADAGWGYNSGSTNGLAMLALAHGLSYSGIGVIDTDGDGFHNDQWYNQEPPTSPAQDFATALVERQEADGSWSSCVWGGPDLCTPLSLLVLQGAPPPGADLNIVKTVTPTIAFPGDAITYTLNFFNSGILTATHIVLTDTAPVGYVTNLSYSASSGIAITVSGAAPPYVWEVSDLTPGAGGVITFTGQVSTELAGSYIFSNTAIITTTTAQDSTPHNNSTAAVIAVLPDLVIDKSVIPRSAIQGDPVTYILHFYNTGLYTATGVVISDVLPVSVTHSSLGYTYNGAAITATGSISYVWNVEDLSVGEGGVITISGQLSCPLAAGNLTNSAVIAATELDRNPLNNIASADLMVQNVTPLAVNDEPPPVVEDSISNTLHVLDNDSDANGDSLSIYAVGAPDQGGAAVNGATVITYTPAADFFGIEVFAYTISDGNGGYAGAIVTVTVQNVNDPPTISNIADQVTKISRPISVAFGIGDSDNDLEGLELNAASSNPPLVAGDQLSFSGGGGQRALIITPTSGLTGTTNITISVEDGQYIVYEAFVLTVKVNTPPTFTSTPVETATVGALYTYHVTAADSDAGDSLVITVTTGPNWLTLNNNGPDSATLGGIPASADVGANAVTLQISDGEAVVSQTFVITVEPGDGHFLFLPLLMSSAAAKARFETTSPPWDWGAETAFYRRR